MSLRKRYTEYRDNRIRRDAFLAWAKNALAEGDVIAVSFPGIEEHYRVVKKAQGRDVVRIKKEYPHCIMCATGTGDTVKKSYESDEDVSDKYLWRRFFSTQLFEIWEEIGRWKDTPPLRHGLTDDEKSFLLDVVRKNSMHHLRTGKQLPATVFGRGSNRLDEPLSAGVAVWCRGEPRGCMIVCDKPCLLSVLEASTRVLSDTRYKPITLEELPDMRTWQYDSKRFGPDMPDAWGNREWFARRLDQKLQQKIDEGIMFREIKPVAFRFRRSVFSVPLKNNLFWWAWRLGVIKRPDYAEGNITTAVSYLQIGELGIVFLPGETPPQLALALRETLKTKHSFVMVVSLADDELGYLLNRVQAQNPLYEYEQTMCVNPDIADILLSELEKLFLP